MCFAYVSVSYSWPNDAYHDESGRYCAGQFVRLVSATIWTCWPEYTVRAPMIVGLLSLGSGTLIAFTSPTCVLTRDLAMTGARLADMGVWLFNAPRKRRKY